MALIAFWILVFTFQMHESKYELAGISHYEIAKKTAHYAYFFRPIVRSLAANIGRIESAWLLLPYLVDATMNSTALTAQAMLNVVGTCDIDDPRQEDIAVKLALENEFGRLSREHVFKTIDDNQMERALARLDQILLHSQQPFIKIGIETVLSSQLLNAWTAVESFTKDLWEASLNHGPKKWVKNVMQKRPIKELKDHEKSVSASVLHNYNFDLRAGMGTILKEKIRYETVADLMDAYVAAFGEDVRAAYKETEFEGIKSLEAIRNLLAHRGGIIDAKFIGKVKQMPSLSGLQLGSKWGCPELTDSGHGVKPRRTHEDTDKQADSRQGELHNGIQAGSIETVACKRTQRGEDRQ